MEVVLLGKSIEAVMNGPVKVARNLKKKKKKTEISVGGHKSLDFLHCTI